MKKINLKKIDLKNINVKKIFKVDAYTSIKVFKVIILVAACGSFIYLGFFVYQFIYRTIAQSDEVILLRRQVALEVVDTKTLETVLDNFQTKKELPKIDWLKVKDPFKEL